MKKALTFLAVSTLALASVDDLGDHEFSRGGGGHARGGGGKAMIPHPHGGPGGHQNSHIGQGLHNFGQGLHHFLNNAHQQKQPHQTKQQNKKDHGHQDHYHPSLHKDGKQGKTGDKKQNDKHPRPEKGDGKSMNFSPPKSDKPSGQQGSPSGQGIPIGPIIQNILDKLFHPGQKRNSNDNAPQKTLEEDKYTVAELESFFEFFKNNKANLNKKFDDAWTLWMKNPNKKQSTYKSSSDSYTVHELESFFTYMKNNQKSLNKDFDECWDGWDAWKSNKKDNAHDNAMFHLHDLMKEEKPLNHFRGSLKN